MKFKELIHTNSWLSVATILLELYPDEAENISAYQDVFEKLSLIPAENSELSISVTKQMDDYDGEAYIDVSGTYEHPKNDDEKYSQAIEFTAWKHWLGMKIGQESLNDFSELEIISHCLYEMTFVGFEEDAIQEELKTIETSIEDYKNKTDEEKQAITTSLEDLLKDLDQEDPNNENPKN